MQQVTPTEIVLIGGSAGSINALRELLSVISPPMAFSIMIVIHRKAYVESMLDNLLETYTPLSVEEAYDKMELFTNRIYLVPADYHLLFESKKEIALDYSEKINYSRPSIDVTFQSAAHIFGKRTTAFLLSGANQDGLEGLRCIQQHGGIIVVQDPTTADVTYMPQQAINNLSVDYILSPSQMGDFINQLNFRINTSTL